MSLPGRAVSDVAFCAALTGGGAPEGGQLTARPLVARDDGLFAAPATPDESAQLLVVGADGSRHVASLAQIPRA